MQPNDDLQSAWMMFDHVKQIQGWMTMASHVYDPIYCKVMTITIRDMQSKNKEAPCILWKKLNAVVENKKVKYAHFQGVHGGWCASKLECCSHCLWD
jgi:hypothetical protein